MQLIPIQAEPNQTVTVVLANQRCQIDLYSKLGRMFVDLYVADSLIVAGALALDRNLLIRSAYLGFVGDLCLIDTQGTSDPTYDRLGERYKLAYFESQELTDPSQFVTVMPNSFSDTDEVLNFYTAASLVNATQVLQPSNMSNIITIDNNTATVDSPASFF